LYQPDVEHGLMEIRFLSGKGRQKIAAEPVKPSVPGTNPNGNSQFPGLECQLFFRENMDANIYKPMVYFRILKVGYIQKMVHIPATFNDGPGVGFAQKKNLRIRKLSFQITG
jgi:hypothetical protein